MVTGNFALITGIKPEAICDWYLAVYADAYDWVELPMMGVGMVERVFETVAHARHVGFTIPVIAR